MSGWEQTSRGATRLGPAAVPASAAVSAREALAGGAPAPAPAPVSPPLPARLAPRELRPAPPPAPTGAAAPGPYLGGDGSHRVSFSVLGDRMRNLRIDGRQMAANARIANGRVQAQHLGFEVVAEWQDESHVEGRVRMRGRWGRGVTFTFSARLRVGDVLAG